ncbi:group-specific protein [Legionella lytica]|uniref:Group-specific protein n=1 Tax=Legionella lytica TaxID=96232 RepID=A0ABY4Y8T9_9GAMM|nr:group-specific protein [Legionella lytica]USQ13514.1 group-specific protein [Legionella lytica]
MSKLAIKAGLFFAMLWGFWGSTNLFAATHRLTPPWELLQNQLSAALEADPCVHVESLTGQGLDMEINVMVCDDKKALALAAFLNKRHEFGDYLAVTVNVYAPNLLPVNALLPDDLEAKAKLLSRALVGNKYFIKTGMGTGPMAQLVAYAIFQPVVIQYYSDDISDWYSNTNDVAAKVFSDVFNLHPFDDTAVQIFPTTAPISKNINK